MKHWGHPAPKLWPLSSAEVDFSQMPWRQRGNYLVGKKVMRKEAKKDETIARVSLSMSSRKFFRAHSG